MAIACTMIHLNSKSLVDLLGQQAHRCPDQLAVRSRHGAYTYLDWWNRVQDFATRLQAAEGSTGMGKRLGICMPRGEEQVLAIWVALYLGVPYVPADPSSPIARLEAVFRDSEVDLVVCFPELHEPLCDRGFRVVDIGSLDDSPTNPFTIPVDASQPAYVLFTSGSTGRPKGVEVPHAAVVNLLDYMQDTYPIEAGDVVLYKSPFTFDGSVWELFGALRAGGCMYIAPEHSEKDPEALYQVFQESNTAFAFFVPAMLRVWVNYLQRKSKGITLPKLRWVSVGGEVLEQALVEDFYQLFPEDKVGLINVYGPTETTVYATTWLAKAKHGYPACPLGTPVTNDAVYLLGEDLRPVLSGEMGEIYIGGAGVALGYVNQAELTASSFLPDPHQPGQRMYRTGDLGVQLPDGVFLFKGRKDFQVKLRGLRIELGEIETALDASRLIGQSVVRVVKDPDGTDVLVAYLLLAPQQEADLGVGSAPEIYSMLRSYLSERLPEYMIPSYFWLVDEFPLTAHGKIDRQALPIFFEQQTSANTTCWKPADSDEATLQRAWQHVLLNTIFTPDSHFFELGGHSLKVVQVLSYLQEVWGCWIPLAEFYKAPIFREQLAHFLAWRQVHPTEQVDQLNTTPSALDNSYPLYDAQRELFVLHELDPSRLTHNIVIAFDLTGKVDEQKWLTTWRICLEEEPAFRMRFEWSGSDVVARLVALPPVHIEVEDWTNLNDAQQLVAWGQRWQQEGQMIFDLSRPPLYRLRLMRLSNTRSRMLWVIHHQIFDGWSLQVFIRRLKHRYANQEYTLPSWHTGDYAQWLQASMLRDNYATSVKFWQVRFPTPLPKVSFPRKSGSDYGSNPGLGNRFWFECSPALTAALDSFAAALQITPFACFLSAWRSVLTRYSSHANFPIVTPFAQRLNPRANEVVGYHTNVLPIQLNQPDPLIPASDWIKEVFEEVTAVLGHHGLSFGRVVDAIFPENRWDTSALAQVFFVMQNWPSIDGQFDGFVLSQEEIGNQTCKGDLYLNTERCNGQYRCWIEYACSKFDSAWIELLASELQAWLVAVIRNPTRPVQALLPLPDVRFRPLQALVLGEGAVAREGMLNLDNQGVAIQGLVTKDVSLKRWAISRGWKVFSSPSLLPPAQVDFLFSLNNPFVIQSALLDQIRIKAINYHDSLLPKYAGLYASAYAILEQQSEHGIVFHEVKPALDAGDVLAVSRFGLLPETTAYQLNWTCFEQAVALFQAQLPNWLDGQFQVVQRALPPVDYRGLADRPAGWGFIYPEMAYEELSALLRACDWGAQQDNPFLIPAIWIRGQVFYCRSAEIEPRLVKQAEVGHICKNAAGWIECIGADYVLEVKTWYGPTPNISSMDAGTSDVFSSPPPDWFTLVQRRAQLAWRQEQEWVRQWRELPPLSFSRLVDSDQAIVLNAYDMPLDRLLAALLAWVFKCMDQTQAWVAYSDAAMQDPWLLDYVPWGFEVNPEDSLKVTLDRWMIRIGKWRNNAFVNSSTLFRYTGIEERQSPFSDLWILEDDYVPAFLPAGVCTIRCFDDRLVVSGIPTSVATLLQATSWSEWSQQSLPWDQVPILPEDLQKGIWDSYNNSGVLSQPFDMASLTERLEAWCLSNPNQLAIQTSRESFTYGQLHQYIQQLAGHLLAAGVTSHDVVALDAIRSAEYIGYVWSCLWIGAAYLPVDITQPRERLVDYCQQAGVTVWMTGSPGRFLPYPSQSVVVPPINVLLTTQNNESPARIDASHIAYILFTSGSTGKPKGVKVSRDALTCFVHGAVERYGWRSTDRIMQFANLTFDASVEEIFVSMMVGATLVLREEDWLLDASFLHAIKQYKISVVDLPTAFWKQLMLYMQERSAVFGQSLRMIVVGGEALNNADWELWNACSYRVQLINSYGPTETTVVALTASLTPELVRNEVPIGRPLIGYQVAVLNGAKQLLPPGLEGFLWITSDAVAHGYCEGSYDAFQFPESLKAFSNTRVYFTGDRVVMRSDQQFLFRGRQDAQVKLRGFRIELSEIEAAIRALPGVKLAEVIPIRHGETVTHLGVIYAGQHREHKWFQQQLADHLPDYMIPTRWTWVEKMPLTSQGKIDRAALLPILLQQAEEVVTDSDLNELEQALHDIWCGALRLPLIDANANFFELGGHSLLAIQIASQIQSRFAVDLPLSAFITDGTIRTMASRIKNQSGVTTSDVLVPIRPEGNERPLFLIHGAGLNVMLYESLTRHLPVGRPLFALQARGLDGKSPLSEDVVAMATDYLQAIQRVQPVGPYQLLGFSAGGYLVFEMVRQLAEQGERVLFAGMIDTVASLAVVPRSRWIRYWRKLSIPCFKVFFAVGVMWRMNKPDRRRFVLAKWRNMKLRLAYYGDRWLKRSTTPAALGEEVRNDPSKLLHAGSLAMMRALRNYELKPTAVTVDLFKAKDQTFYLEDPNHYGWTSFALDGVVIHELPGDHARIFAPPHDRLFAEKLAKRLAELNSIDDDA